jgi:O-antigen ligase
VATFFATYYYHGNAGAFLNLALPAVLGLAFRYTSRPAHPATRALWLTVLLVMIVAVISDTSRMGQFVALAMFLGLLVISAGPIFRQVRFIEWKTVLIAIVVVVLAVWAIARTSHVDQSMKRWDRSRDTWTHDARWLVDRAAIAALPEAGALGFGPGTFAVVFPHFNRLDERAQGDWLFLHDDPLQTLMEWGWVGGLLWAALFVGGIFVATRRLREKRRPVRWLSRRRLILPLAIVALCGVALHALVDFPLQISSIQLYAATYLGICWGSAGWKTDVGREGGEGQRMGSGQLATGAVPRYLRS